MGWIRSLRSAMFTPGRAIRTDYAFWLGVRWERRQPLPPSTLPSRTRVGCIGFVELAELLRRSFLRVSDHSPRSLQLRRESASVVIEVPRVVSL